MSVKKKEQQYIHQIQQHINQGHALRKNELEKIARSYGIEDQTEAKEYAELAIVELAREIATDQTLNNEQKLAALVELYQKQPSLTHRTSRSVINQQYSTPAPYAWIAQTFLELDGHTTLFEPSAGNGLLTIANLPKNTTVNEIDVVRLENLRTQGFKEVLNVDASQPFPQFEKKFDRVITNPPFQKIPKEQRVSVPSIDGQTYAFEKLEHLMVAKALATLKDDGRTAIIIGDHNKYGKTGLLQGANRLFLNWLYQNYKVVDVINIDKDIYRKQGTSYPTRLILIAGRRKEASNEHYAPLQAQREDKEVVVTTFRALYDRVQSAISTLPNKEKNHPKMKKNPTSTANQNEKPVASSGNVPYIPASEGIRLDTQSPERMYLYTKESLEKIKAEKGDIDDWVAFELGYSSKMALHAALSGEQVDSVALAIYNIERGAAIIIGDMTGVGKGRQAAAIIRYAIRQGKKPIFLTEKSNLFSDLYRDMLAIGSAEYAPFILNQDTKANILDKEGKKVYKATGKEANADRQEALENLSIPEEFDYMVATYSQFSQKGWTPKKNLLDKVAKNNILVLDESHNASGESQTGEFLQAVVQSSKGIAFLSATYAKRADNMPIYATKTAMRNANLTASQLIYVIQEGGVALQEILSSDLVESGQMVRRERGFEGIEMSFKSATKFAKQHRAIADKVVAIVQDIIAFQELFVTPLIEVINKQLSKQGKLAGLTQGTQKAGAHNTPYFNKVFNVVDQLLFALKANFVAEEALRVLKKGQKPVIAFKSTMGSFLNHMGYEVGMEVENLDFALSLQRGLDGVMTYTETGTNNIKVKQQIVLGDLDADGIKMYQAISKKIKQVSSGLTISPIDVIIQKIEAEGYMVGEVTGRDKVVRFTDGTHTKGKIEARKSKNTNQIVNSFNAGETDVLMLNAAGATGLSAHAHKDFADQRKRVMLIHQLDLDINKIIQMLGRINRTGQVEKPAYIFMTTEIPAEKRMLMMAEQKLKSLNANTVSAQESNVATFKVGDFLNKVGDRVVQEYLTENKGFDALLGYVSTTGREGLARKATGRVAILPSKDQEHFYEEIMSAYQAEIEYLNQIGENDLEVQTLPLRATTLQKVLLIKGKGGDTPFGKDTYFEEVEADQLTKPYLKKEIEEELTEYLDGKTSNQIRDELTEQFRFVNDQKRDAEKAKVKDKYEVYIELAQKNADSAEDAQQQVSKLEKERDEKLQKIAGNYHNHYEKIYHRLFDKFVVGKALYLPNFRDDRVTPVECIFLGWDIDLKASNPFAPSKIRLKIAIGDSRRVLKLPGSKERQILQIIHVNDYRYLNTEQVLDNWDSSNRNQKKRELRHLITGNVLQAGLEWFNKGTLVSYTDDKGKLKKGILLRPDVVEDRKSALLPVKLAPGSNLKDMMESLPVRTFVGNPFVRDKIKNLEYPHAIEIEGEPIKIGKVRQGHLAIRVPSSTKLGGTYFKDETLLPLVENENFEKRGQYMFGLIKNEKIDALLDYLEAKGFSVNLTQNEAEKATLMQEALDKKEKATQEKQRQALAEKQRKEMARQKKLNKTQETQAKPENKKTELSKTQALALLKLRARALRLRRKRNLEQAA